MFAAMLGVLPVPPPNEEPVQVGNSWRLPLICAVCTAAMTWWVWGFWEPIPYVHDEAAYLLQSGIFASGRWVDPAVPLPAFFEQMHVLSVPTRAAKYPPGHSLLLAPGSALGIPALVPVLLAGVAGALLIVLARRFSNRTVAFSTWVVWLLSPGGLTHRSGYFSESTTTVLWLLGWWALDRWIATSRGRWLALLSGCVGWGCMTRPLTTVAFALPAAVAALWVLRRRSAWGQLGFAIVPFLAVMSVIPLWNLETTGDWKVTPIGLYTRTYLPWDKLGFGLDRTTPKRELPAGLAEWLDSFQAAHAKHAVARLPEILAERSMSIVRDVWGGWYAPLFAFALVGAFLAPRPVRLGLTSAGLLVLLYLLYAHPPGWSIYYVESYPVFAFLTALGLFGTLGWFSRSGFGVAPGYLAGAAMIAVAILGLMGAYAQRTRNLRRFEHQSRFRALLRAIPDVEAVAFVRHGSGHDAHRSLVTNGPDLSHQRVWVAYDRSAENESLCRIAPERTPYLYDEARRSLSRLPSGCASP
jgi:hypothetical protein